MRWTRNMFSFAYTVLALCRFAFAYSMNFDANSAMVGGAGFSSGPCTTSPRSARRI